jgi:hypothetical protein
MEIADEKSSDEYRLISCSDDGMLCFWNFESEEQELSVKNKKSNFDSMENHEVDVKMRQVKELKPIHHL